jgi:hypothetical protein
MDVVFICEGSEAWPKIPVSNPQSMSLDLKNMLLKYQASTWSKDYNTFDSKPKEFTRATFETICDFFDVPTFIDLFRKFWPWNPIRQL